MNVSEGDILILNALTSSAAILNEDGVIIAANKSWESGAVSLNWLGIQPKGDNYFEHCMRAVESGNDNALRLIFLMREVLDGDKKAAEITISVRSKNKIWCKVSMSVIQNSPKQILLTFDDITKNMKTLSSLREKEERYSQQFKHSISGIILGTPDGQILDANPAACNMLGYSRLEMIEGGRSLIVDDSDPMHLEMIEKRKETSQFEGEKVYRHKNGNDIPVEITSVMYRQENGEFYVLNTFRDKSEEKLTLDTLNKERRFSRTVLNSVPGLFLVIDTSLDLIRWNQSFQYELGYDEDELKTLNVLSLFAEEDKLWIEKVLHQIFKTGKGNFVTRVLSKIHGLRYYNFHVNSFENVDENYLVVTAIDVTDFRNSENEREKNFNLLTQLFDNSPMPMVMIDPDNIVQKVNEGFLSLFGYNESELIGNEVDSLITSDAEIEEAKKVSSEAFQGYANQQEAIRHTKDGEQIPVIVSTVPVYHENEVIAAYGIYVDLRQQKDLEYNLQKSLDEKNVLLQEVHHRVKNNLAIIAGLLELQSMYEEDSNVVKKLNEARNRVFSIAKIHETLYQQKNFIEIQFDEYLFSVLKSMPYGNRISLDDISAKGKNEPLLLNLNQAVPLGLAINELIHFESLVRNSQTPISISLIKNKNDEVILGINGLKITGPSELESESQEVAFKQLLIETFINQLEASITYPENGNELLTIQFKNNRFLKGSSNALIGNRELINEL